MLGLLPAAVSQGIGAQTQKPLAVVVIGGSLVLAGLTRVLQPPLLVLAHRWRAGRGGGPDRPPREKEDVMPAHGVAATAGVREEQEVEVGAP